MDGSKDKDGEYVDVGRDTATGTAAGLTDWFLGFTSGAKTQTVATEPQPEPMTLAQAETQIKALNDEPTKGELLRILERQNELLAKEYRTMGEVMEIVELRKKEEEIRAKAKLEPEAKPEPEPEPQSQPPYETMTMAEAEARIKAEDDDRMMGELAAQGIYEHERNDAHRVIERRPELDIWITRPRRWDIMNHCADVIDTKPDAEPDRIWKSANERYKERQAQKQAERKEQAKKHDQFIETVQGFLTDAETNRKSIIAEIQKGIATQDKILTKVDVIDRDMMGWFFVVPILCVLWVLFMGYVFDRQRMHINSVINNATMPCFPCTFQAPAPKFFAIESVGCFYDSTAGPAFKYKMDRVSSVHECAKLAASKNLTVIGVRSPDARAAFWAYVESLNNPDRHRELIKAHTETPNKFECWAGTSKLSAACHGRSKDCYVLDGAFKIGTDMSNAVYSVESVR